MKGIPAIPAALLSCAFALGSPTNGSFEDTPFSSGWTNSGAVLTSGFAPGSSQAARFTGSGQSLRQSVSWSDNWHLDCYFMVQETIDRQFSLIIETANGVTALNLRYQDGWQAFSGGWGPIFDLGPLLPSADHNHDGDCDDAGEMKNVYRLRVTGHAWGTPSPTYDLALSSANETAFASTVTGLSRYQSAPTTTTPTSIKFSTEFGSNPGFWLDDVSSHETFTGPPTVIRSFAAEGNNLIWEVENPTTLTLDPGNIEVSGLTSYRVNPTMTTTYTLSAGGEARSFTIGVHEPFSPLKISEFLARNPEGQDWIELHNPNNFSLNLEGYALTDDPAKPDQFTFPPTVIQPGEYYVLNAGDLGFSLSGSGEYLALFDQSGSLLTDFSPLYPAQFSGVSYGLFGSDYAYLGTPTPGTPNLATPHLTDHTFTINPDGGLTISAIAGSSANALSNVSLHYRRMFDGESSLPMTLAGGRYSATLPHDLAAPGEMIRWRLTATDSVSETKFPLHPTDDSPEYFGTVAPDPSLTSALPVLQWFLPPSSFAAADTREGTRCSLFWRGEFYDHILVHLRGATTAALEKKPHQFEFNPSHEFQLHPDAPRVDQINVNAAYPDSSYLRDILPMENLALMGMPAPDTFPVRVQRNGSFHSLGIMIEQPDREFLERHDTLLDPEGALFKATGNGSWLASTTGFEARNDSSLADLSTFASALNAPGQLDFLLENTDLPSLVNYLAVNVIDSIFNPQKNYYIHQNRFGEWMVLPWDRDFSYGHRWLGSGDPRGSAGPATFLVTDERYEWGGSNHDDKGGYNRLFNAIFSHPKTSEMFYRRLRTTIDTVMAPGKLESRLEHYRTLMKPEADLDRFSWGFTNDSNYRRFPQEPFDQALDRIRDIYLPARRLFLESDGGHPARGTLPESQPSLPSINFGQIVTNPSSGDQDDEFLELTNPNDFAVDLSNWTLSGAITHTLRPGTVIPANSSLVLSPKVSQYRTKNPPAFTQGNYSGHFSNFSETLTLNDSSGILVATTTTPNLPSPNQLHLVISEIMYHPTDDASEFLELLNTSNHLTLDLSGVAFSKGVEFTFPNGTTLSPGERIVISSFPSGRLANEGETLKLDDTDGSTISEFTYSNTAPWPLAPDGSGPSLTYLGGDPNSPQSWRPSVHPGGSPGSSDTIPFNGDDLLSYAIRNEHFDFDSKTLAVQQNPGADHAMITPEWSFDLKTWHSTDFTLVSTTPLTWIVPDQNQTTFFRLRVSFR